MVYVSIVAHFNAAHKLVNPAWDTQKNQEVFGKCANENWHGHNYELHVTVKGEPHPDTGFVFNAKTLAELIEALIEEPVDHKNLNIDVPWMQGKFTTAEQFAIGIWNQLEPAIKVHGACLHCVKLYETPRIYVEYFG